MPPKLKKKAAPKRKQAASRRLQDPISIVLYGPSGSGKTSLAGHFPNPAYICDDQEQGVKYLLRRNLVPKPVVDPLFLPADEWQSWAKLLEAIYAVARDSKVQTLIVESVTGFENVCFLDHCHHNFNDNWTEDGFFNYWRGPKVAARRDWPKLISAFNTVLESGKNVIVTAHTQIKEETDPQGVKVMRYTPYCEKDTWARLHRWASALFFLGPQVEEDTQRNRGSLKNVAKSNVYDRLLFTEGTPYCDAKNWHGMKGVIRLGNTPKEGYDNLMKVLGY